MIRRQMNLADAGPGPAQLPSPVAAVPPCSRQRQTNARPPRMHAMPHSLHLHVPPV